ncbi:acyltransferase family protein [Agaribacterium haliotis]|uniref:acyltransferase family protein n=1 Tax=Agaribacterium haliotis TaxID=2013869 RepID=UPI00130454A5|nr:acyltransferase [Agaribacterium haliotis]
MIYSVQYMRAIAAFLVVVHHAALKGKQYGDAPLSWFHIGGVGVDLFFIISGYIMCHTVAQKRISPISFIQARIRRIIPIYWLLTSFALVIYFIMPDKVNSSGGSTNILASYLLFPTEDKYLINNGWTLSFEFFFYFIFCTCLSLVPPKRYLFPALILVALAGLGLISASKNEVLAFITSPFLLEFAFGIFAYLSLANASIKHRALGVSLIFFACTMIILVNQNHDYLPRVAAYGLPALLFFVGMLSLEPVFQKHREQSAWKILKACGDSSYSLYLFHPFALVICSIILSKFGLAEHGYVFIAALTGLSVVSGHLCYVLLEQPMAKAIKAMHHAPKTDRRAFFSKI